MANASPAPLPQQEKHTELPSPGRLKIAALIVLHHAKKHMGVGVVCSVAYFDPGNWGVDLQAGSQFGYRLLFVVLLAGLFAVYLQVLASRLGCVTGIDLASHTRLLLYNRPKHTLLYRWLGLYPLYILAEVAIIATDLAELLGSAIALCLLFPRLELWQGVLLTAVDVIVILAIGDPLRGRPAKAFEFLIAGLVLAVMVCMIVIISKVDVNWEHAFDGYLPSNFIFTSGGLYTSVGILGATVMPHSLFLGSALATQDRLSMRPEISQDEKAIAVSPDLSGTVIVHRNTPTRLRRYFQSFKLSLARAFRKPPPSVFSTKATRHSERENNPLEFVKAHVHHGVVDVVGSLLGFAVMINSLILMLASAVFFYGKGMTGADASEDPNPASLFDAYDLINDVVGKPAATLFAVALLAAGQSSSIVATIAGQAVSEGFLQWRVSPVVRRLATRLIAIIPSVIVAVSIGRKGIDTLLVASQVILSIVLPFVFVPLLYCTSSKSIMSVRKTSPGSLISSEMTLGSPGDLETLSDEKVDFSNNLLTSLVGAVIWVVVMGANFYVIVSLGRGADVSG